MRKVKGHISQLWHATNSVVIQLDEKYKTEDIELFDDCEVDIRDNTKKENTRSVDKGSEE